MDIGSFVFESIKSLLISAVLLIIGLVFLPESWVITITKIIKPKILETIKLPFRKLINAIANLYINNSMIDINEEFPEFNVRSEYYLKENKKIEKDLYVIDLCKDMIATLNFAAPRSIGDDRYDLYEESLYYLYHYSRIAEQLDQDKNFVGNFLDKVEELRIVYQETREIDTDTKTTKTIIEHCTRGIHKYLEEEKIKLNRIYEDNKRKLIKLITDKSNEI